jgi:hypothetical protein
LFVAADDGDAPSRMGFFSSSRKDDRADDRDGAASVAKLLRARFVCRGAPRCVFPG